MQAPHTNRATCTQRFTSANSRVDGSAMNAATRASAGRSLDAAFATLRLRLPGSTRSAAPAEMLTWPGRSAGDYQLGRRVLAFDAAAALGAHDVRVGDDRRDRSEGRLLRLLLLRRLAALHPALAAQLVAQAAHRQALRLRAREPLLLCLRIERGNLGVVAEGEAIAPPRRLDARGHVDHVHERLHVVARDARGTHVALAEARVAVQEPIADPPADA